MFEKYLGFITVIFMECKTTTLQSYTAQ